MNDFVLGLKSVFSGRKGKIIFLLFALGVALLVISALLPSSSESDGEKISLSEYKARAEEEFANFCREIDGVGKCRVMITFSEGESYEYRGGEIISSSPPKVLGVTVICSGGDKATVKAAVAEMAAALFDIGKNRICVLKLS